MLGFKPRATGALLAAATLALAGNAAGAPIDGARATAPKAGQYIGETHQKREATLNVVSRAVKSGVLEVECRLGSGRVSLGRMGLRETARGYEFAWSGRRTIVYDDGHARETASVVLSGRFSETGRRARGVVRVNARHCGNSGAVRWSATFTATPVKAPKPGVYTGPTEQQLALGLSVSGRSIEVVAIEFKCGDAIGRTVLNDVRMRRTRKGYAFALRGNGSATYSDDYPDENVAIDVSGRFTPSGSRASGNVSVTSPRCGKTGQVGWTVKRATPQ